MTNEQLVTRIQSGIDEADNMLALWEQNQGIVHQIAKKYTAYENIEDLKQEAFMGMCKAIDFYDPAEGTLFMTYALFWIKATINRYIETCGSVVRIPGAERHLVNKYRKFTSDFIKWYGREATDKEISVLLEVSHKRIAEIRKTIAKGQIRSLDEPIGEDDSLLSDCIPSNEDIEEDVISRLDREDMVKELWDAVDQLPEDQRQAIYDRYRDNLTYAESCEHSRTLLHNAMRTLRLPSKCKGYKAYYEVYLSAASGLRVGLSEFKRTWTSAVEKEALRN